MPACLSHRRVWASRATVLGLALGLGPVTPGLVQAQPGEPSSGSLTIEHDAPRCVAAEKYARLSACFRPDMAVARGRIFFRPVKTKDWFYVDMAGTPPCLQGVLPRPRKDLEGIEYYISGMDRQFAETRTPERTLQVSESRTCPAGAVAPVAESATVVIGSASGAAPVGFLTGGSVPVGLIAGLAGGAAAVAAAMLASTTLAT